MPVNQSQILYKKILLIVIFLQGIFASDAKAQSNGWQYTEEGLHGLPSLEYILQYEGEDEEQYLRLGINCLDDYDYSIDLDTNLTDIKDTLKVFYYFYEPNEDQFFNFIGYSKSSKHFQIPKENRESLIKLWNRYAEFGDYRGIRLKFGEEEVIQMSTWANWYDTGMPLADSCGESTKSDWDRSSIIIPGIYLATIGIFILLVPAGLLTGLTILLKKTDYYGGKIYKTIRFLFYLVVAIGMLILVMGIFALGYYMLI